MKDLKSDSFLNREPIPFYQFEQVCGRFDRLQALRFLQKKSAQLASTPEKMDFIDAGYFKEDIRNFHYVIITADAISFLSKLIIRNARFSMPLTVSRFLDLVIMFNHLETDLTDPDSKQKGSERWLPRVSYAQWRYKRPPDMQLGRYHLLFNEIGSQPISDMILEATNLTPTEIIAIGLSFYTNLLVNEFLNLDQLISHEIPQLKDILTPEKTQHFLKQMTISVQRFKKECLKWNFHPLLKKYEPNPLRLRPIIEVSETDGKAEFIVPSLPDLILRSTEGIYYSVKDFFRGENKDNQFSTEFGFLFEKYIGFLLKDVQKFNSNLGSLKPERSLIYGSRHSRKKPADWILEQNNNVIQIECKAATTSDAFRAGITDDSRSDFDTILRRYSEEVKKLCKKKNDIKSGFLQLSTNNIEKVFTLIVILDEFYHIDSRFKKDISSLAAQDQNYASDFKFHILSCTNFEILCEFLKEKPGETLHHVLMEKEKKENYSKELNDFLKDEYHFSCDKISLLTKAYNDFFDSIGFHTPNTLEKT